MAQVVVGGIIDHLGSAARWDGFTRTYWSAPSNKFRRTQPSEIPVEAGHGGPAIGSVEHLEIRGGKLWVVAEVGDAYDVGRQPWMLSYDLTVKRDGLLDLEAIAIVERSATCCMPLLEVAPGKLWEAAVHKRGTGHVHELIQHAYMTQRARKHGPLEIRDFAMEARLERETRRQPSLMPEPLIYGGPERGRPVAPQQRAGFRPGMVEWSGHRGRVLAVR
jgi:hypothetical protein